MGPKGYDLETWRIPQAPSLINGFYLVHQPNLLVFGRCKFLKFQVQKHAMNKKAQNCVCVYIDIYTCIYIYMYYLCIFFYITHIYIYSTCNYIHVFIPLHM